jgi:preprotein translocase subunit SecA
MRMFGSQRIASLMDRMGLEEGEVIQHSMITKSIERAQMKVEENNFGIRKRLLEYDDVMNSQRTVIYKKRLNALFGERLDVDLDDMIVDLCEELTIQYQDERNFEGFRLEIIRLFSADITINENDFLNKKSNEIADDLYQELSAFYKRKSNRLAESTMPVLKDIYESKGQTIENMSKLGVKLNSVIAFEPDKNNFKRLLKISIENNLYMKEDYAKNPKEYCGISVSDSPLD